MLPWQTSKYIWNYGLVQACDAGIKYKTPEAWFKGEPYYDRREYENLKAGDLVWINGRFLRQFCDDILPRLSVPIVLLICDGDDHFPDDCDIAPEILTYNENIVHIFAQNNMYGEDQKVSSIPIGLDMHTVAYRGGGWGETSMTPEGQDMMLTLTAQNGGREKKKRAFVDFQHSDTMRAGYKRYLQFGEDRQQIFQRLLLSAPNLIDHGPRRSRSDLWKTKAQYAFSICPMGNGLQTHRLWEDLVLGCICIVKSSPINPLYRGLPVVIVNDWDEITEENFDLWLSIYGNPLDNPSYRERLTNKYWINKMRSKFTRG